MKKRIVSLLLAVIMVVSVIFATVLPASAASQGAAFEYLKNLIITKGKYVSDSSYYSYLPGKASGASDEFVLMYYPADNKITLSEYKQLDMGVSTECLIHLTESYSSSTDFFFALTIFGVDYFATGEISVPSYVEVGPVSTTYCDNPPDVSVSEMKQMITIMISFLLLDADRVLHQSNYCIQDFGYKKFDAGCPGPTKNVESVSLNKSSLTLDVGEEQKLTATVYPSDAIYSGITWSSNDSSVASISSSGLVTAKKAGTTQIKATAGGKTATCTVTVQHVHQFTDYVSDNNATCAKDGTKTAYCDKGCGEKNTITDVGSKDKVAHKPDGNTDCSKATYCTVCHKELKAAGSHAWEQDKTTAATCTKTGSASFHCENCPATKEEVLPALGHDTQYAASDNVITETCSRCDHSETATLTAEDETYTGSAVESGEVDYSTDWQGGKLTISYSNNIQAGEAQASVTCDTATAKTTFQIERAPYTLTLSNLNQQAGRLSPVTADVSPEDESAVIKVEYGVNQSAAPCTHVHDAFCGYTEDSPCTHVHDEFCGYREAGIVWSEEMPTTAGSYPVRASVKESLNLLIPEPMEYTEGTLTITAGSSHHGGIAPRPAQKTEEDTKPDAAKVTILMTIGKTELSINQDIVKSDVAPIIRNNRTMLPVRLVAEALGAKVEWDSAARKVSIISDDVVIVLTVDSDIAVVNGKEARLDSPAFIENNRTYTPMRFVAVALGAKVQWDASTQTVTITK